MEREIFDITASAAAASAFAGLLAAIVLAVTVQIAVSVDVKSRERSLIGAPLVLVTLLVAAYFFVLIAGEPPISALFANETGQVLPSLEFQVERSSYLFAIAGTVLAAGAVLAVYIIALVIIDNGEGRIASDPARLSYALSAVAAGTMLAFGFKDIEIAVAGANPGLGWWLLRICAFVLPCIIAALVNPWSGGELRFGLLASGGTVLIVGPVAMFMWTTDVASFADLPHVGLVTFFGSLYFGSAIGVAGWHLRPPPSPSGP